MNGNELKQKRQSIEWTQADLADACGVDIRTISRWEAAEEHERQTDKLLGYVFREEAFLRSKKED